jgi:hypothetical protein
MPVESLSSLTAEELNTLSYLTSLLISRSVDAQDLVILGNFFIALGSNLVLMAGQGD